MDGRKDEDGRAGDGRREERDGRRKGRRTESIFGGSEKLVINENLNSIS